MSSGEQTPKTTSTNWLEALEKRLETGSSQYSHALAEKIFSHLFFRPQDISTLDTQFTPLLQQMQSIFSDYVHLDIGFFQQSTHPLRQVLENLVKRGSTWYPRDSRASQIFNEQLTQLIQASIVWMKYVVNQQQKNSQAQSTEKAKTTPLLKALADFMHWANSEEKRATLLEQRLCETEASQLKILAAELKSIAVINSAFENLMLPTELSLQLHNHLKVCLQNTYINEGEDSGFWRKWQQLAKLMQKIFTALDAQDNQQLYRDIPIAINELDMSIPLSGSAQTTYTEFVSTTTQLLMQIVQNQAVSTFRFQAIEAEHQLPSTRLSKSLRQEISHYQAGDWFAIKNEQDQWIRCKLCLVSEEADSLIFVDNCGRKVTNKTQAEFSVLRSSGFARTLQKFQLDLAIQEAVVGFLKNPATKNQPTPEKNKEPAKQQTAAADNAQPTDQALAAKKHAAEKARAEALALAKQQVDAEIQRSNDKAQKPKASLNPHETKTVDTPSVTQTATAVVSDSQLTPLDKNLCIEHIEALSVGAGLAIQLDDTEPQKAKLAVIIAGSKKYILVNNIGRKIGEFHFDQLVDLMQQHRLKILNQGEKFEDQLIKVIRGLRKDIT